MILCKMYGSDNEEYNMYLRFKYNMFRLKNVSDLDEAVVLDLSQNCTWGVVAETILESINGTIPWVEYENYTWDNYVYVYGANNYFRLGRQKISKPHQAVLARLKYDLQNECGVKHTKIYRKIVTALGEDVMVFHTQVAKLELWSVLDIIQVSVHNWVEDYELEVKASIKNFITNILPGWYD